MVNFTILAGGYDVFVATYLFNSLTSSLTLQSKSPTGTNPSWIALNPKNPCLLYAVNENTVGALQSLSINQNGTLTVLDTVPSGGNGPAFATALSNGQVAVMNYGSGNGRIIPTTSHGKEFDSSAQTITFPTPPGDVSHPHMTVEYNHELFVPDLGRDTIWRLKEKHYDSGHYYIQGSIPQPKGSGPRHMAIHNNRLFTLHETASTLSVQTIPPSPNGSAITFATVTILPANPPKGAVYAAAEILIPLPTLKFPKPYIYVSNRNTGVQTPEGDTIAIFEHVNQGQYNEGLVLITQVPTGLNQIRSMAFGSKENGGEEFLMAGGFAGQGGVIMLRRTEQGRNLEIVARNQEISTRTSFVWL